MDTVEELNNTYFYAGRMNLRASELLFIIFCECTAEQLRVDDFSAIVAIFSGLNISPTRAKPVDAIKGTSLASRDSRWVFGNRSWLTFKKHLLSGETTLNHSLNMDPEEAAELIIEIFDAFGMDSDVMNFDAYFSKYRKDEKPLSINMLIESARVGRWLYDERASALFSSSRSLSKLTGIV